LRATLEESFYNVTVTPSELWQKVGARLERARMDRRWKRAGGPSYKTVQAIDNGGTATVRGLEEYARALDLSIVDILHDVLTATATKLSPEAAHIVRKFNETTVAGRTALVAMANALPSEGVAPAATPPAGAAAPPAPTAPQPAPPGIKRRTAR
jgi:hypothetical protein